MYSKASTSKRAEVVISVALIVSILLSGEPLHAQQNIQQRIKERFGNINDDKHTGAKKFKIAGLDVAVWQPVHAIGKLPLVIFSHGFHGCNTQSLFIVQAMDREGYLVMAPNHKDAIGGGAIAKPEQSFRKPEQWNDSTFKDRGDDIKRLIAALHKDPRWNLYIDWTKVALAGHSLGGYTVLALGGAWPSWKQPNIRAILALSPYCEPFVDSGNLAAIGIPVMYQGGTRDLGITPTIKNLRGALSKTSSPACFVEFDKLGHLGWTNFNKNQEQKTLINYYCLSFLNKYVEDNQKSRPDVKLAGVADLQVK